METTAIMQQAIDKIYAEIEKEKPAEDSHIRLYAIHLIQNMDDKLAEGVLDELKSLKKSDNYVLNKAKKVATGDGDKKAVIHCDTVYGWLKDYFLTYEEKPEPEKPVTPVAKAIEKLPTSKPKEAPPKPKSNQVSFEDLLGGAM